MVFLNGDNKFLKCSQQYSSNFPLSDTLQMVSSIKGVFEKANKFFNASS